MYKEFVKVDTNRSLLYKDYPKWLEYDLKVLLRNDCKFVNDGPVIRLFSPKRVILKKLIEGTISDKLEWEEIDYQRDFQLKLDGWFFKVWQGYGTDILNIHENTVYIDVTNSQKNPVDFGISIDQDLKKELRDEVNKYFSRKNVLRTNESVENLLSIVSELV